MPILAPLFTATLPKRAASLPANDWRSRDSEFQGAASRHNLYLAEVMRDIAARRSVEVGAVAVAWTLAWPGVTGAIVGARRPAQVNGWIDAANLSLTVSELEQIADAIAFEDRAKIPPVAVIVGKLRVLQLRVELGHLTQEVHVRPFAA